MTLVNFQCQSQDVFWREKSFVCFKVASFARYKLHRKPGEYSLEATAEKIPFWYSFRVGELLLQLLPIIIIIILHMSITFCSAVFTEYHFKDSVTHTVSLHSFLKTISRQIFKALQNFVMLINSLKRVGTESTLYGLNRYTHLLERIRYYERHASFYLFLPIKNVEIFQASSSVEQVCCQRKESEVNFWSPFCNDNVGDNCSRGLLKSELYWKEKESPESEHPGSPEANIARRKYPPDVAAQVSPLTSLSLESSI